MQSEDTKLVVIVPVSIGNKILNNLNKLPRGRPLRGFRHVFPEDVTTRSGGDTSDDWISDILDIFGTPKGDVAETVEVATKKLKSDAGFMQVLRLLVMKSLPGLEALWKNWLSNPEPQTPEKVKNEARKNAAQAQ